MVSRCLFPGRLDPRLWVTSDQPLAPEGFRIAVLQREALRPWHHKCKFPMRSPSHQYQFAQGAGRRRKARAMEEYFHPYTAFTAEYPNWLLWIRYLFTAMKVKSDSAPMFIHFPPRLSVWGLSGVAFSKAALVHLEAVGDLQLISCGLPQAAIHCQRRSGSSQTLQCSSKVKFCIIMMKHFKHLKYIQIGERI